MESPEPESSLSGDVAAGGAWGLAGRVVVLGAILVATPFTIRLLGPAAYGLWALLQTALTWASLADLGMATASTKFAAECYEARDDNGESAVVWTALVMTGAATFCLALLVGIAAPEIIHLMRVPRDLVAPGTAALRIVCGIFVVQSVAGTVNTPQLVRLRWRQYTFITQGANVIFVAGVPIALAIVSKGVATASVVWLGAALIGATGNLLLGIYFQPALRSVRFRSDLVRPLLSYGGALTVSGLASIPLATGERFLLAHYHSTAVVAQYSVAWSLGTILLVLPEQVMLPLIPGLVRLEASGRLDEHRDLYRKSLQTLFLILMPATMLLAFVAHPFLSKWAGLEYGRYSSGPLFVILVGMLFNSFSYVPFSYLASSGRTKTIAYIHLAEVVPYLAIAAVLTARFGAMGAAFSWSGISAINSLIHFIVVKRVRRLPSSPLPSRRLAAVVGLGALGATLAAVATEAHGLALRLACAAGIGVVYALITWRVVLSAQERRGLLTLLRELLANARRS